MTYRQSKGPQKPQSPSEINLTASEWLIRLLDADFDPDEPFPDPLERRKAFLDWLRLSPTHVRSFLEIMEVERRARHRDPQRRAQAHELLLASQQAVIDLLERLPGKRRTAAALESGDITNRDTAGEGRRRRNVMIAAIAAAIAAGIAAIAFGLMLIPRPVTASSVYYSSSVGERQLIALNDGSTMFLNAASKVAVTYDRHTREVRLLAGQAFFDVHHDADRPFRVIADDVFLEDIGTKFDVNRRPGSIRISVIEGSVRLMCGCTGPADAAASESPRLWNALAHPATAMTLSSEDQVDVIPGNATIVHRRLGSEQLAHTIAWKEGELYFDGDVLSAVIEEFNRYSPHRIVIADPAIANYQVGGGCKVADAEACARVVERAAGVVVLPPDRAEPTTIRLGRDASASADRTESSQPKSPR